MLTIKRISSTDHGTFGVMLKDDATPFCVTLEREWRNNESNVSCIPPGTYNVIRVTTPKHGETFEVTNVPGGRFAILFHVGNTQEDLQGCIAVGKSFGMLHGLPAIQSSGAAFKLFMEHLKGVDAFVLRIINCY